MCTIASGDWVVIAIVIGFVAVRITRIITNNWKSMS